MIILFLILFLLMGYYLWTRNNPLRSRSQMGQDKAVLSYYKNKTTGYFVEIGAWDGVTLSNTFLLEKLGWSGICVEPLPERYKELIQHRTCKTYQCAVDLEGGKTLNFVTAGMLSGDVNRVDKARIAKELGSNPLKLDSTIQVKTRNLTELLQEAEAPRFIEFLSLDTEGSELDILMGVDYNIYTFGYISVEHNFKEPQRSKIREFLISKGYTFHRENECDDDYIFLS